MKPVGVCQCADETCLERTPIAPRNDKRFGHVKGQPVKYIWGHGPHVRKAGGLRPRRKAAAVEPDETETFSTARKRFLDEALRYGRVLAREQPEVIEDVKHDLHDLAAEQSIAAA